MLALADEKLESPDDMNEMIPWKNFVPVGLEAICTIYKRNLSGQNKPVSNDALSIVYENEIKKCEQLLTQSLRSCDKCHLSKSLELTGLISLKDFKNICRTTKFLTPKESNLMIRNQTDEWVNYNKFKEMVYEVRFEIAVSKIMDINMDNLENIIL
jgi:hypothetical protein